jgi:hypothetical protein
VGKGAIAGWRDVIVPAMADHGLEVALWPFEGSLERLIAPGRVVIAETYPAEFFDHFGVTFPAGRAGEKREFQLLTGASIDGHVPRGPRG